MCYIVKNKYLSIDIKGNSMEFIKKNIFSILAIVATIFGGWYAFDRRITVLEERDKERQQTLLIIQSKMENYVSRGEMVEVKNSLKDINTKLDRVIERELGK
jgi:hypothetical protein